LPAEDEREREARDAAVDVAVVGDVEQHVEHEDERDEEPPPIDADDDGGLDRLVAAHPAVTRLHDLDRLLRPQERMRVHRLVRPPKTSLRRSLTRAAGLARIARSCSPTTWKSPSSALPVTYRSTSTFSALTKGRPSASPVISLYWRTTPTSV